MLILGLTGGMAMGKSTVARMFRQYHIPVFDADQEVHALQGQDGEALSLIRKLVPQAVGAAGVDRKILRRAISKQPQLISRLEKILHPFVYKRMRHFLNQCRKRQVEICVLDIPLLYETDFWKECDKILVVSSPKLLQILRIKLREKFLCEEVSVLLARQMSDAEKRQRSDYVVFTGLSHAFTRRQVKRLIYKLSKLGKFGE